MTHPPSDIEKDLITLADPVLAEHAKTFFKTGKGQYGEGDRFLGIRVPELRKLAKKYRELTLTEVKRLLPSPWHEQRLLALFLLTGLFQTGDEGLRGEIFTLYMASTRHINNWDLVDSSAHLIPGPWLLDRDKKPLYDFSRSKNLWERRIAIIATFHYIKRERFDEALKISSLLLEDSEDLIHKAVGWMLREIGNRSLEAEMDFLDPHYRIMPRTMLRYAIEKFPEPLRRAYLKGAR